MDLLPPTRSERHVAEANGRDWASVRTILDALILAGIIWIVSSQLDSRVQSATIIAQVAAIQASIADVPAIRDNMTKITTRQDELTRRVNTLEAHDQAHRQ